MAKLSVICCTNRRNPRFDLILDSLKRQTFTDFEYILVDELYQHRKEEVLSLFQNTSFKFKYFPDKPNRWLGIRTALPNSRNTALIFAEGQQVVFHDDCSKLDNNFLARHALGAEQGLCVAGTWISYEKEWDEGPYGKEYRGRMIKQPEQCTTDWLYGANFSVPLQAAVTVNGNDELYCGEMGVEDCDFGIRIGRAGYKAIFDAECIVHYVVNPNEAQTKLGEKTGTKGLSLLPRYFDQGTGMRFAGELQYATKSNQDWEYEKKRTPKQRMLDDGKLQFSNEWLIQLLHKQSSRWWTLGNAFCLSDLRAKWQDYKQYVDGLQRFWKVLEDWQWPYDYDWRDGQKIEEMNAPLRAHTRKGKIMPDWHEPRRRSIPRVPS